MGYAQPFKSAHAAPKPPQTPAPLGESSAPDAGGGEIASRSGFERFFAREWPKLRLYLRRRVGEDEAEDIAQEAFARVARAQDVRHASGLLYQAARRLVIDGQRARGRSGAVLVHDASIEAVADPAPSPEAAAEARLTLERVGAMLELMSPKCRAVFTARVVEGLSYGEIAERLSMSQKAVEKQLLRAFEICARWRGQQHRDRRARV